MSRLSRLRCTLGVALALSGTPQLVAADLPTVTVEHLYYLQTRGASVRRLKPDEVIEYCLAQKLGGPAFENLYGQLAAMRTDLAKLLNVEGVDARDARVVKLKFTIDVYLGLLREEADRIRNGLIREGQIASETLDAISRAQNAP